MNRPWMKAGQVAWEEWFPMNDCYKTAQMLPFFLIH